MRVLQIDIVGNKKKIDIFRKVVAHSLDIHARDLRPVFNVRQVATLITRDRCFILNLGNIKMIVERDTLVVMSLNSVVTQEYFLPSLTNALKKKSHKNFPLFVLDHTLSFKAKRLKKLFLQIESSAKVLLADLESGFLERNLQDLLRLKKQISKFQIKVKENESAIEDILEDEEEIEQLAQMAEYGDNEEVESILESFLEQQEELIHKMSEINENIDDTQEITSLKLQTRRNVIMRLDLLATLTAGSLSFLTLITGLFGMNLLSHQETNANAFFIVTGILIVLFFLFIFGIVYYLKKRRVL